VEATRSFFTFFLCYVCRTGAR